MAAGARVELYRVGERWSAGWWHPEGYSSGLSGVASHDAASVLRLTIATAEAATGARVRVVLLPEVAATSTQVLAAVPVGASLVVVPR